MSDPYAAVKEAVQTRGVTIRLSEDDQTEIGMLTVGQLEEDGSMTLSLMVTSTHWFTGAADSVDTLEDDIRHLIDLAKDPKIVTVSELER